MAGLTPVPGMGANSWDEANWAKAMAAGLPRFFVADAAAWKASPNTGLDRVVQLAAGGGWGCGVWDVTTATENAPQHAANTTGADRYDLVVARYNWTTRTRTFAVIQGTSTPPAINATTTLDTTKVNRIPGTRYDGLVAIVKVRPGVGAFAATDITDARVWGNDALQVTALTSLLQTLLDATDVTDLSLRWEMRKIGGTWRKVSGPPATLVSSGSFGGSGLAPQNASTGIVDLSFNSPIATDDCDVVYSASLSAGADALQEGHTRLFMNGVEYHNPYGQWTQSEPERIPGAFRCPVAAGENHFVMILQLGGGPASGLRYSSLLIQI